MSQTRIRRASPTLITSTTSPFLESGTLALPGTNVPVILAVRKHVRVFGSVHEPVQQSSLGNALANAEPHQGWYFSCSLLLTWNYPLLFES